MKLPPLAQEAPSEKKWSLEEGLATVAHLCLGDAGKVDRRVARWRAIFLILLALALGAAAAISLWRGPARGSQPRTAPAHQEAGLLAASNMQDAVSESRRNALVRAIEHVSPAVVSVNVVHVERVVDPFTRDFWDMFSSPRYLLRERKQNSVGSGFIIDKDGHIVTNYHVIADSNVTSVRLTDGRIIDCDLVGVDDRTDVAVLKAKASDLPHVEFGDSDGLMIGEWVVAIGNPFGILMNDPQPSATVGVISANHRRVSPRIAEGERLYQDMIQTDASINPGNSGGPLVNAEGDVVGVNTMIFSPSGGSIGLGFAIPVNRVKRVASEIIQHGRRRDPWAGFKVEDVSALREDFRDQLNVRTDSGALVVNILTNAPAYDAGLRPGDIIVEINRQPVQAAVDVDFALWNSFVGDTMTLGVNRGGQSEIVRFQLKELKSRQDN